ncbi:hypothetical protein [Tengunoibacter tsumagoiensis]|uniref:Uncharacterized protein n=1 Tax=Tengunoibacter tsumagoiensis TaxID=2014871 RepID=A0A401ZVW1_9CHLR|nr:hypothetical protein [Tengunoibacter tsumagoiensis]GCE10900.1 hypothetical protein KTT_07590 [Tengunoibacter tsumagoiensis]
MAEPQSDLSHKAAILQRAEWNKWNRFTWSGLLIIFFGLILILIGLTLQTGAYSPEGILIGLGIITIIAGIIRVLIGLINPFTPEDLDAISASAQRERRSRRVLHDTKITQEDLDTLYQTDQESDGV